MCVCARARARVCVCGTEIIRGSAFTGGLIFGRLILTCASQQSIYNAMPEIDYTSTTQNAIHQLVYLEKTAQLSTVVSAKIERICNAVVSNHIFVWF